MFDTIKSKLYALLFVLIAGFLLLVFMQIKINEDSAKATERLTMIESIGADFNALRMEIRGYQLDFNKQRREDFEKTYIEVNKKLDNLASSENEEIKTSIKELKENAKAWYENNENRIVLIEKYQAGIHTPEFKNSAEGASFKAFTKNASSLNGPMNQKVIKLSKIVKDESLQIISLDRKIIFLSILIVGAVAIAAFIFIMRSISISVANTKNVCNEILNSKDLTKPIDTGSKDEIGEAMLKVNTLLSGISQAFGEAKRSASENASVAAELSITTIQIGKRAEDAAKAIDETNRASSEVSTILSKSEAELAHGKNDINIASNEVYNAAKEALSVSDELQQIVVGQLKLSERLDRLSSEAEQVKSVLTVIAEIADQTNLLALNAAIEAARAGEHGRGFAVVADEVRKLAERTQKSLSESNATVSVIVDSIADATDSMSLSAKSIGKLGERAGKLKETMNDTAELIAKTAKEASKSVEDTAEGNAKIKSMLKNIESINELSAANARSIEEIASAAERLSKLAEGLSVNLSRYKSA